MTVVSGRIGCSRGSMTVVPGRMGCRRALILHWELLAFLYKHPALIPGMRK